MAQAVKWERSNKGRKSRKGRRGEAEWGGRERGRKEERGLKMGMERRIGQSINPWSSSLTFHRRATASIVDNAQLGGCCAETPHIAPGGVVLMIVVLR